MNYLVLGLGNPGIRYNQTRHNAGFMFVDTLAHKAGVFFVNSKFRRVDHCSFQIGNDRIILAKSHTFMNLSGKVLPFLKRKYSLKDENIFVAVDNLDLVPGRLRLRSGGSDAGHNGLKSVSSFIDRKVYNKIYIGIGRSNNEEVIPYVLSRPSDEDLEAIYNGIDKAADLILKHSFSDLSELKNLINSYRQ